MCTPSMNKFAIHHFRSAADSAVRKVGLWQAAGHLPLVFLIFLDHNLFAFKSVFFQRTHDRTPRLVGKTVNGAEKLHIKCVK